MEWLKRFKAWLRAPEFPESSLKDWQPSTYLFESYRQPTRVECSDERSPVESTAPAVELGPTSEPQSDENSDDGEGIPQNPPDDDAWFWAETEEEKAIADDPATAFVTALSPIEMLERAAIREDLEHADHLPDSTFRVFPSAGNHRNSYDSPTSVRRAVAQRKSQRSWVYAATRVYRAETVWRDVTSEYVKP